jgi:hypothetical protein
LQRTVDNHSRAYPWLISHDLSHGVPLMASLNYLLLWCQIILQLYILQQLHWKGMFDESHTTS